MARTMLGDSSARTIARFQAAMRVLRNAGLESRSLELIQKASRPNGSMNFSRLLELAQSVAVVSLIDEVNDGSEPQ